MTGDNNRWSARLPLTIGFLGLLVLLGGFGGWSVATEIAGAIIAQGRIEVEQNRQVIQHPTGGVVAEIAAEEGDMVAAGDLLVRLDDTALRSQLTINEGQLFEIIARRGRLEAERDGKSQIVFLPELLARAETDKEVAELVEGQRNLFHARRESLDKESEQLDKRQIQIRNQIEGIDAQIVSLEEQVSLIEEELDSQQSLLKRGLAPATTVLALRRNLANLQGQLGELAAGRAQAEARITETEIEILKLGTQLREQAITQLRDMRYRELELREQHAALSEELSRLEIRAPVSGVIYGLTVQTMRSVVRAAEPVAYIVPQDRPLVIATQVEPVHIDEIMVGQTVNLRFSALDQRSTPELLGRVVLISADAFEDEQTRRTYYRAEIQLEPGEIERLGEGVALIPGMPVEAYIKTSNRTPLAYLTKPLMDYFNRAFRET